MDASKFDRLTRVLTAGASRRRVLRGLASAGLGLTVSWIPGAVEAKKRKPKKLKRNGFGCVEVGQACRGNSANCCSGICEGKKPRKGKKDKSRCAGHDAGVCQVAPGVCAGAGVVCGPIRICVQSTGKGCYCASTGGACAVCQRDTDCVAQGWGLNAACIPSEGCPGTSDTYCATSGL